MRGKSSGDSFNEPVIQRVGSGILQEHEPTFRDLSGNERVELVVVRQIFVEGLRTEVEQRLVRKSEMASDRKSVV